VVTRVKDMTGTCSVCGTVTRYSGRPGKTVSEMCRPCSNRVRGLEQRGKEGKTAEVLAYLAEPRRISDIREHFAMSHQYAHALLHRLMDYGMVERVERGVYVRRS
jgi:hypothetical protein